MNAPNDPKITGQLAALSVLRAAGQMIIGWDDGQITPMAARALVRAGLARAPTGIQCGNLVVPIRK